MNDKNEVLEENLSNEAPIASEAPKTIDSCADAQPKAKPNRSFGVAAMVFGILSLVTFIFPLPMGTYFPLIGVIFAIFDRNKNGKMTKEGKSGFICSIIAYSIYVLAILAVIALFALGFAFLPEIIAELEGLIPPELLDMLNSL